MDRDALLEELARLYDLTLRLRGECPWDRKQTQETIIAYTVEETYELADAIARRAEWGDDPVRGELGDLLFQVYFMACVAEEEGLYDLGDIAAGIRAKLIRRHPHVFGEAVADTPDQVRETWEVIKREAEGREGIFHEIPDAFPSILFAQKLQQRAAAVGFDWEHAREVMAKVKEETAEVEEELAGALAVGETSAAHDALSAEVGDLLFAVVNLARKLGVDPELALRGSSLRFRNRVQAAAEAATVDGLEFEGMPLQEQEAYYQRAKKEQQV